MKNIQMIEIPTSELKTALTGLGKVVSRRSVLPVLQSIRVSRNQAGQVTLQGTDLDSFATYKTLTVQEGEPVEFLVPVEHLAKAMKSTKDRIGLAPDGKESVILRTFVSSTPIEQKLPAPAIEEWPPVPEVPAPAISLDHTFRQTMDQAWECASVDESRYILNSVFVDVSEPKAHYVVATNGRVLFSANSFAFDLKDSVIIPTRKFLGWGGWWTDGVAQLAIKPPEKGKPAQKGKPEEPEKPGWLQFSTDRWTFTTKQIEGDYPNWKQVVPATTPATSIRIPENAIDLVLEILARIPGDYEPNYPVSLNTANHALILQGQSKGQDQPASIPVLEAVVKGKPVVMCLNRLNLVKALRFGLNEIQIIDAETPVICTAQGKKMVIAPVRLSGPVPTTTVPASATPSAAAPPTTSTQTPPPAEPQATAAANPNERTNMPRATANNTTTETTTTETADSPIRQAMEHIEKIKDTLKAVIHEFNDVLGLLKSAEKDKKTSDKEIESVREKLREIQSVRI